MKAIIRYFKENYPQEDNLLLAYIIGTVEYETDCKFKPMMDKRKGRGQIYGTMTKQNGKPYSKPIQLYYGRGYVPLIWYETYKKFGEKLNIDLLKNPDLILSDINAIPALVDGMMKGWYTGRKLSEFINDKKIDLIGARSVIQKGIRSEIIAELAKKNLESISLSRL